MKKFRLTHIVGARPNFVKASPLWASLAEEGFTQFLIHTGQHYDEMMSDSFFRDLSLPTPDFNLNVGGGDQFGQLSKLFSSLPSAIQETRPDLLIVYGDVNSSMAAAVVGTRLGIRVAHVEAGLRSFDNSMPEETNRKIIDMVATVHLTTSPEARGNLQKEGIDVQQTENIGNTMIDTLFASLPLIKSNNITKRLALPEKYAVATIHRAGNVDDDESAMKIVEGLVAASNLIHVILPLHPRGRDRLTRLGLQGPNITICDPLGYLDFLALVASATLVITDSGGVQEETTVLQIPCLTLRPNTERPITISEGSNRLASAAHLGELVANILEGNFEIKGPPPLWDGFAAKRGAKYLKSFLETVGVSS